MRWLLLAVPALANQLVTLAPEPQLTTSAAPAVSAASLEPSAQAASIFEPKPFWQPILPSQHIPAGLEVRMNLESGLREARLPQEDQDQSYEFSSQFEHARELAHSGDFAATDAALDDLLEFSHDYRYGYKIIGHEFPWLAQLLCDSQTPVSTKRSASPCWPRVCETTRLLSSSCTKQTRTSCLLCSPRCAPSRSFLPRPTVPFWQSATSPLSRRSRRSLRPKSTRMCFWSCAAGETNTFA